MSNDPDELQQIALVPARLLAPGSEGRSWREAVVHEADHVPEVAAEWQRLAAQATFLEMGGFVGGAGRDRTWELVGRIAATGEQLGLAYAAAIEVDFWRQAKMGSDSVKPAYEMGHRAMAELQAYFTVGSGHGLVNVAARTLALDRDLRDALAVKDQRWRNAFPPFSESKGDWPPLSQQTAGRLSEVAALSPYPEVRELLKPVVTLQTDERWRKLDAYRSKTFHRWRPQSAGLAGVSQRSPWVRLPDGQGWRLTQFARVDYRDADKLADEASQVVTASMVAVADAMQQFLEGFGRASGLLGGPRFKQSEEPTLGSAEPT